MKFRKKPVVIQAMLFTGENGREIQIWAHRGLPAMANCIVRVISPYLDGRTLMSVRTLEGEMFASPGDWIVKGIKGEFYPVKPDIFEDTYEAVE